MTGSSVPNVVIVVVVITRDSGGDPASPATTADEAGQARTRHEHAQADDSQSPERQPE